MLRRQQLQARKLRRPYAIGNIADEAPAVGLQGDLCMIITWLQDTAVIPIDMRLPGRPFEYDIQSFPFSPTVLVIGNHSSGKSTFINRLLGIQIQETGVAPTDDGFTVLERHPTTNEVEDGPTLMGCPENVPFRDLQRFGRAFLGNFRRKRMYLPEETSMPFGLQIVDSPGMIDLPANGRTSSGARGYNFVEVVRWWAKHADLILLLFDPDKPGTTGETLEVLTKSLIGLEHKFLVVLNKVDQLDNSVDFARAYGTLGWALAKVIPQKDFPQIWTMYNASADGQEPSASNHKLPLEAFVRRRKEVVAEVLRAKARHWDNVISSFEEMLRQIEMVATVSGAISAAVRRQQLVICAVAAPGLAAPAIAVVTARLLAQNRFSDWPGSWLGPVVVLLLYLLLCYGVVKFLQTYLRQFERLQVARLDTYFQECYASFFIHSDGEDLRIRWTTVRPRVISLLAAVESLSELPQISSWEITRINEILEKDVWHLRQLARLLRKSKSASKNGKADGPIIAE